MKFQQRVCLALSLCLIFHPLPAWPASSEAQPNGAGYVCVPNAQADGWECDEDRGQRPVVYWDKIVPYDRRSEAVPETSSTRGAEAAAVQQAADASISATPTATPSAPPPAIDPDTGMSSNPDDWYTPTAPRTVDETHAIKPDLAAALYFSGGAGMCPGGYQPRAYPHPRDTDPEQFPIVVEADQLTTQIDVSAKLDGNVTIEQGNRIILTDAAELDYPTRVLRFPAGVRIDQPGIVMQGDSASVNLNSKEAQMENAQFVLTDASMRGRTQQLAQNAGGDLSMTRNTFTRCEPGYNGWSLSTRELVIEEDAVFGTARGAVLRVKSVPVFYKPYMQIPVSDERLSGILFPDFGYSDEDGVDFSIPY